MRPVRRRWRSAGGARRPPGGGSFLHGAFRFDPREWTNDGAMRVASAGRILWAGLRGAPPCSGGLLKRSCESAARASLRAVAAPGRVPPPRCGGEGDASNGSLFPRARGGELAVVSPLRACFAARDALTDFIHRDEVLDRGRDVPRRR